MSVIPIRESAVFSSLPGMVFESSEMGDVADRVRRIARTQAPVLLRGASGTGKSLLARAIHQLGSRSGAAFRAVNCAALTPEYGVAELFGSLDAGYAGQPKQRRGQVCLADGGTLFLGQVGALSMAAQARLLRLIEDNTVLPLGAVKSTWVDVRLTASTHRPLDELVRDGRFREDLMYRLRVIPLDVPCLVARYGDLEPLMWHFIHELNGPLRVIESICAGAMEAARAYSWPGNVRELRNAIEYAMAVGEGPELSVADLPPDVVNNSPESVTGPQVVTLEEMDRRRIMAAMEQAGGRRGSAAKILGISRSTLWRRLRYHRLAG